MALAPLAAVTPAPAPLTAGALQLTAPAAVAAKAAVLAPGGGFQQLFADAVAKTAQLQQVAEEKQRQLITGEVEDLHEVMIAMEKASLAFSLTQQVRNKVIEAYQEVMRMQV
jgi:flagellar hook-basal body complex protein FliE